jgi:hypothetical protein
MSLGGIHMKLKIFFIILTLLLFCSTCKSPESPDDQITNGDQTPTTGTISGTVTDANTSTQIAGASVSTSPATTTVTTNAVGNYTISNVSPASYTVTASASGYLTNSTGVTVTAGQTATANLALQPEATTGTISGTVTDEGTGLPIVGASVSTQPATTTVNTDGLGSYTISDVSPGSYTVTASASNYMDDSTSVAVTAGQTATADLMLQADYSGSWSGTTSQGREISFTIVNNAFTQFKFGFAVSGFGCTTSGTVEITYSVPKTFSGNTFTISGSAYQMTYSFSGTFLSLTTASGSGSVTTTGGCTGTASFTWSANKN